MTNFSEKLVHSKTDEIICDLQRDSLVVIQKKEGFRFGTDAVLLSDFAASVKADRILDFCTGSGIVPILLYAKTKASEIHGVEIQEPLADMAQRSVELNGIGGRVFIRCADLRDSGLRSGYFDMITCNPPYMRCGSAIANADDSKTIARHEVMCTINDVTEQAKKLLKNKGHLVLVHRPSRLSDVIFSMKSCGIEPKRLRFVHTTSDKPPVLFLIDGVLGGGSELKVMNPLILTAPDGGESDELKEIYGRKFS